MLEPGAIFHDRYRVLRCIKLGGMGSVHAVFDLATERQRALKTMLPNLLVDAEMRSRFVGEMKVTAPIRSQHIVEVFDAGLDAQSGTPFLVMELLEGEDLGTLVSRRGSLSSEEVVVLLRQVARALDRTHQAGIIHRDLKPENVFVAKCDDGSPHVKILDFGIAKALSVGHVRTTRSLGTPLYMSPEQVRGDGRIDGRADLYSLGQLAFVLLTGTAYFQPESNHSSSPYGLLLWVANGVPESATERARRFGTTLPAAFDEWFEKATAVNPNDRFSTAGGMIQSLEVALQVHSEGGWSPAPRSERSPSSPALEVFGSSHAGIRSPSPSTRVLRVAAAFGVATVVAGVGWKVVGRNGRGDETLAATVAASSMPSSQPAPASRGSGSSDLAPPPHASSSADPVATNRARPAATPRPATTVGKASTQRANHGARRSANEEPSDPSDYR